MNCIRMSFSDKYESLIFDMNARKKEHYSRVEKGFWDKIFAIIPEGKNSVVFQWEKNEWPRHEPITRTNQWNKNFYKNTIRLHTNVITITQNMGFNHALIINRNTFAAQTTTARRTYGQCVASQTRKSISIISLWWVYLLWGLRNPSKLHHSKYSICTVYCSSQAKTRCCDGHW